MLLKALDFSPSVRSHIGVWRSKTRAAVTPAVSPPLFMTVATAHQERAHKLTAVFLMYDINLT